MNDKERLMLDQMERIEAELQVLCGCISGACALLESEGSRDAVVISNALQIQIQRLYELITEASRNPVR
jgi:hypothetical protein